MLEALRLPCLAERELAYLYAEQNLLSAEQLQSIVADLGLDRDYLMRRLSDNRRPVELVMAMERPRRNSRGHGALRCRHRDNRQG